MTYHNFDKLVILDSEDLIDMDFACYTSTTGAAVDMVWEYDKKTKATTIRLKDKSPN